MNTQIFPTKRREFDAFTAFEAFALCPSAATIRPKEYLIAFRAYNNAGEVLDPSLFSCSYSDSLKKPFTYLVPSTRGELLLVSSPVTVDAEVAWLDVDVVAWSQGADQHVAQIIRDGLWMHFREKGGTTWARKI